MNTSGDLLQPLFLKVLNMLELQTHPSVHRAYHLKGSCVHPWGDPRMFEGLFKDVHTVPLNDMRDGQKDGFGVRTFIQNLIRDFIWVYLTLIDLIWLYLTSFYLFYLIWPYLILCWLYFDLSWLYFDFILPYFDFVWSYLILFDLILIIFDLTRPYFDFIWPYLTLFRYQ